MWWFVGGLEGSGKEWEWPGLWLNLQERVTIAKVVAALPQSDAYKVYLS